MSYLQEIADRNTWSHAKAFDRDLPMGLDIFQWSGQ